MGPWLYGLAFCAALPALLAWWAWRLEPVVALPRVRAPALGGAIALAGLALWAWGVWSLRVHGGGAPMNAYPPPRLATRGAFKWMRHPLYVGFVMVVAGAAVAAGSRAGLWIVAPVAALGCAALVLGFEGPALARRFPTSSLRPRLSLPRDEAGLATWWERASVCVLVLAPWLMVYEAVGHVPVSGGVSGAATVWLPGEERWPVWAWTEAVYATAYAMVCLVPVCVRDRRGLRRFALDGVVAIVLVHLVYLALPVVSPPRVFDGQGFWADMLRLERADGLNGRAAFPAFHVIWPILAARALGANGALWGAAGTAWALAIAASCLTTGMHATTDVLAAAPMAAAIIARRRIYAALLTGSQAVANSWREWRIGPVRIISHAAFAGLAAGAGFIIMSMLAGTGMWPWLMGVSVAAMVGAGLWGQYWVGRATTLLRPFGYFGAIIGGGAGVLVIWVSLGGDAGWRVLAAGAVAAPWVQAIGRFRCLVNGCCHGAPCAADSGIRYRHPRSRVVRLSGLGDHPVHPTPLYSILGNMVIGVVLARMAWSGAPMPLIAGVYLVLAGMARFVEESLRGEPHTPVWRGLRLYQWCALAMVLAGVMLSSVHHDGMLAIQRPDTAAVMAGLLVACLYAFAMGVDFPESTRRFSRLT